MSFGARCLYHVLRGYLRFDNLNNGKDLYRPYRKAAEDLGTKSKTSVQRWYRELEHYGFIVMTEPGSLILEALQPVLDHRPEVHPYTPGSWGPAAANALTGEHGWLLGQTE